MYTYTLPQWILFFFWYCFLGWIWECFYVSSRKAHANHHWHWINRGFLNGPVIPIYGFAAISILIGTIRVREHLFLVFILGALAATLMELITGSTMERIFHVKYWDYSSLPLNYKGHICFFVSLFWGFLSIVLVRFIHVPVERYLIKAPTLLTEGCAFLFIGVFMYDFNDSLRAALDMKELLEKLTESRVIIERLEKRVDAIAAFAPLPDLSEIKELHGNTKEKIASRLEYRRNKRISALENLKERILSSDLALPDREELLTQLENQIHAVFMRTNKQFYRTSIHLKHNPTAVSKKYKEAFEELKELFEERK